MSRSNVGQRAVSHPWPGRRQVKLGAHIYLLHTTRHEAEGRHRRHEHKDR